VAVSGLKLESFPATLVFIIKLCFFIKFSKFPLQLGHFISFSLINSNIFLSEKLSAGTSNFSSINLSALKIALHFVHLIILSAKVSKWPDACHTISGRTVGPSNSLNPFALKTFLTLFSTLFFNNLPIGP